jgi:hypothetical protein
LLERVQTSRAVHALSSRLRCVDRQRQVHCTYIVERSPCSLGAHLHVPQARLQRRQLYANSRRRLATLARHAHILPASETCCPCSEASCYRAVGSSQRRLDCGGTLSAQVVLTSPALCMSPGLTNETAQLVHGATHRATYPRSGRLFNLCAAARRVFRLLCMRSQRARCDNNALAAWRSVGGPG